MNELYNQLSALLNEWTKTNDELTTSGEHEYKQLLRNTHPNEFLALNHLSKETLIDIILNNYFIIESIEEEIENEEYRMMEGN
jgi:hypothetical protein